jgi:hypothetical protein
LRADEPSRRILAVGGSLSLGSTPTLIFKKKRGSNKEQNPMKKKIRKEIKMFC